MGHGMECPRCKNLLGEKGECLNAECVGSPFTPSLFGAFITREDGTEIPADQATPMDLFGTPAVETPKVEIVLVCKVTGNSCGTDTHAEGHTCNCESCRVWEVQEHKRLEAIGLDQFKKTSGEFKANSPDAIKAKLEELKARNPIPGILSMPMPHTPDPVTAEQVKGSAFASEEPVLYAELTCPRCLVKHVDRGEWATRKHHKHLCGFCGHLWRVEPYTFGVESAFKVSCVEKDCTNQNPALSLMGYCTLHNQMSLEAINAAGARAGNAIGEFMERAILEGGSPRLAAKLKEDRFREPVDIGATKGKPRKLSHSLPQPTCPTCHHRHLGDGSCWVPLVARGVFCQCTGDRIIVDQKEINGVIVESTEEPRFDIHEEE